jgi:hypothetical protein
MARNAHKKAKQGLKRAKKKKEARRLLTLSPFRRAAHAGQLECYQGLSNSGLATLLVLGHVSSGTYVMSGFLVDLWCVGLKDAWGQKQITRPGFEQEILPKWRQAGETITRIEPEAARRLIAGAIRFSHQNGFRLPEHWDRYAAILGNLGDIPHADLSQFGVDGKLRYVGTQEFLAERLAGCTMQEFLQRPDIEFIFGGPDFAEYDAMDEDVDDDDFDEEEDGGEESDAEIAPDEDEGPP